MKTPMVVVGGGLAGAAAAIAARQAGADVRVFEQSRFPRHKVCGEFLSPEAGLVLAELGLWEPFLRLDPWQVREVAVQIGKVEKKWELADPAFGISRFSLDAFLLDQARLRGAEVVPERGELPSNPAVIAVGRQQRSRAGNRVFGFKAHYTGPTTHRIDLIFDREMYVGINCIEGGRTNVCGLASESLLRESGFRPDILIGTKPTLAERLGDLRQVTEWLITGPLVYGANSGTGTFPNQYLAGDALGFIDPFTGSGMLAALCTGTVAGRNCAEEVSVPEHLRQCRRMLAGQYVASSAFRKLIGWGLAENLAWLLPGRALFRATRPRVEPALKKNPASARRKALAGWNRSH